MTEGQGEPDGDPRDTAAAAPAPIADGGTFVARRRAMRGGTIGCAFSTAVLALAVVFGGISAYEQPEKNWMVLASWGIALIFVLAVAAFARRRGRPGLIPGVLIGIGLTGLFAGWCYFAS